MQHRRHLSAGEVLFRAGDPGEVAYLVESGVVEIYLERAGGTQAIARLGSNELFGEMALAGDHTRTASARALDDAELLVITHEALAAQLARASPVLRHLLRVTMARSRDSLRLAGRGGAEPQAPPAFVDPEHDGELAAQQLRAERELSQALQAGEFELHYQPIVALDNGRVAGFEALIRWRDPRRGLLLPAAFIDVAEASPLIIDIGHWIIDTATAALARMDAATGAVQPFCSINLSPRQFDEPQPLLAHIREALARHALAPQRLCLEITESAAFDNPLAARPLLEQCRTLGCKVLIDDFGTGYGTLSYLHRLPIDAIKLDRSFIREIAGNAGATAIIRAMTQLATDLGLYTVAEGIESAEQAARCAQLGVRYGQGFLYSKGVPLDAALAMLRA
ncbi:EAL domain-containing protein [Solimonas soli]|uniref:EAL domain-containing protein n=1 Tax=Solimonas soli TaxID=413479 RepID=UPI0004AE1F44|nr:EAL domain-containing protein [Solimonas soli]